MAHNRTKRCEQLYCAIILLLWFVFHMSLASFALNFSILPCNVDVVPNVFHHGVQLLVQLLKHMETTGLPRLRSVLHQVSPLLRTTLFPFSDGGPGFED